MKYLENLFNLNNKIIVVTGGSGVIGSELAKGFLKADSKVILLDKNEERLITKVNELKKINKNTFGYTCDVLDESSISSVNDLIIKKFKRIDVLVNAAGGQIPGTTLKPQQPVFELGIENFNKVTELNLVGTVLPTFVIGKTMAKQKHGSIINISSMAAIRSITRVVGYSAAKAAIDNFTKWMAVELALKFGDGLRVNAIAPGFFITNQNKNILVTKNGKLTPRSKLILKQTPFKRFGKPEELVGVSLFLASDASQFITGTVIPVDGGFSVFSGV
ncbi:MAG: SDR family oxidoreductase [Ignavibacteriales bacterium]|nr:MAG: SDR family oxidoreductase [Ignavibacteriales bacterium]